MLPVTTSILDNLVAVGTIGQGGDIISVDTEVAVVLVHPLDRGQVRSVGNNLVNPMERIKKIKDGGLA